MNWFFAELKRRNVYKVAIAYVVIAWLLIEVGWILFPVFRIPPSLTEFFIAVIVAGFPVALFIAWLFEMTPDGMKRTENVSPNEFVPQWSKRKFVTLIVSIALLALGLLIFQLWRSGKASISPGPSAKIEHYRGRDFA